MCHFLSTLFLGFSSSCMTPVFGTNSTLEFKYACSLSDIQGKPCYGVIEADDDACNPAGMAGIDLIH